MPRKESDKRYLQGKKERGWKRLWIPPKLVEQVKRLLEEHKANK